MMDAIILTPIESIKLVLNQAEINAKLVIEALLRPDNTQKYTINIKASLSQQQIDTARDLLKQAWPGCIVYCLARKIGIDPFVIFVIDTDAEEQETQSDE